MFHVENLLTEAGEPFVYALIFLPDSGLTARVSESNAHSIEVFADVGTPVPWRVYFVECADRLKSAEEPPISTSFYGSDVVRQVADELKRLSRHPVVKKTRKHS
jgi:hypothetical protein